MLTDFAGIHDLITFQAAEKKKIYLYPNMTHNF